jgi:hypothetical protein
MALQVVLFGHSFVRRLKDYIEKNPIHENLGLSALKFEVCCFGFGGLSLKQRRRLHCVDSKLRLSDMVILDIGSNDICNPDYLPDKFAQDLVSYAEFLVIGLQVKRVVIMQLLPRDVLPYSGYNEHVIQVNNLVQALVTSSELPLTFWKHRGLWHSKHCIFSRDGIHLGQEVGYPKYLRSIRDCIIRVSNWA